VDKFIEFALITHPNSKYFVNANHINFSLLAKYYKASSFKIQSKNLFNDKNISRVKIYSQLFEIFNLFKSMIVVRVNIIKYSKSFFFRPNLKHVFMILYIFLSQLVKFFCALFNLRSYKQFRQNLIRQSNISASHLTLMKKSLESGKSYVLILEDDFLIQDLQLMDEMLKFATSYEISNSKLQLINLSKSFSYLELGFQNLVKNSFKSNKLQNYSIDVLKYPVTNTVCATLYKSDFLKKLVWELENLNQISIIPIDHKINIALNKLIKKGSIDKESYGSSNPSLFIQGSLHG